MKPIKLLVATAIAAPVWISAPMIPAQAAMGNEECQPLTADNREECCEQDNWRDLILPEDFRFCPKLRDDDNSGRLGDQFTNNPGDNNPEEPPPTTGSTGNNPGHDKMVGKAGEKEEKGMINDTSDTVGTKGKSN